MPMNRIPALQRPVLHAMLPFLLIGVASHASLQAENHDYAEALQVGLTFLEVNEAGHTSPLNRLEWRGDSFLDDGEDVGHDLTGGWMDAGDHLKANNSMAPAASNTAWAVLTFPEVYQRNGQMPYVLNSLRFISDYFDRCIVDGNPNDPDDFSDYSVYVNIGSQVFDPANPGTNIAPDPRVHSVWCPPEVIDGYTARQTLMIDTSNPNTPEAGHMSSALAAAAVVLHRYGTAQDQELAEEYYATAAKLSTFARQYFAYDGTALQPDGKKVHGIYMSYDAKVEWATSIGMWSELWLQQLADELDIDQGAVTHRELADQILNDYLAAGKELWELSASWKFRGYNHHIFMLMLQMGGLSDDERDTYEDAVLGLIDRYALGTGGTVFTPGGLSRKNNHYVFLLHHVVRTCAIAAMYADYTEDATYRDRFKNYIKSQVDYILGSNPVAKSFLIGYGDFGLIHHHRGAHGTWDGNQYWSGAAYFMPRMRHIAYGALLGGPNDKDEYTVDDDLDFVNHKQAEPVISQVGHLQVATAYLVDLDPDAYAAIENFPAPEERILTDDPEWTDHEIYVAARSLSSGADEIRLQTTIYNRSSWPARIMRQPSYRYYFTADDGETDPADFTLTVSSSDGGEAGAIVQVADDLFYAEVAFPDQTLMPNRLNSIRYWRRSATVTITASSGSFDSSDDPSDVTAGSEELVNLTIPVYEDGVLVAGSEPGTVDSHRRIGIAVSDRSIEDYTISVTPATAAVEADELDDRYRIEAPPTSDVTIGFMAPTATPIGES